ncbi:hypothetical protein F441_21735 [Phytophthora nicotianae CJ01A1]|uniref:Uncharacterized protein n=6 Tax=Phytophthora nicotianae TaxID=4792 RepID=W2QVX4_PHYN3|nr:hypothetical protein PPTG_21907 [Phytophthora nicotianae INRA-310]ETI31129.1 hypothetical protein F443_21853 [Phytophthora nicotianae P1569]ETK71512.1 hypothetical protein L915_21247 [Phytophthora nicotianae]ETO59844.1 hypothetical protein F444_21875 [Phytophthora nicotianae P1976]ETP00948.1 hypothetical protein F441_21735 [Phytophthora nicotianae CJ01A1]ETP29084.1 hypothetical protein F442_21713 [Phytophthora nicotianae P10297]
MALDNMASLDFSLCISAATSDMARQAEHALRLRQSALVVLRLRWLRKARRQRRASE